MDCSQSKIFMKMGCPIPWGAQEQAEWGPKQPDLVPDIMAGWPAHSWESGIRDHLWMVEVPD